MNGHGHFLYSIPSTQCINYEKLVRRLAKSYRSGITANGGGMRQSR